MAHAKERRWSRAVTERSNAGVFATIATFPDHPQDLESELVQFAVRLSMNCVCSRDGKFLRRLVQNEGERYPELFAAWREDGPGKTWAALAARFARLAHGGYLDLDDPDAAARQFLALNSADLVAQATATYQSTVTYPTGNNLAPGLKLIAKLSKWIECPCAKESSSHRAAGS